MESAVFFILWLLLFTAPVWVMVLAFLWVTKSLAKDYARKATQKERDEWMRSFGESIQISGYISGLRGQGGLIGYLLYWKLFQHRFERAYSKEMDRICEEQRPFIEARVREEEQRKKELQAWKKENDEIWARQKRLWAEEDERRRKIKELLAGKTEEENEKENEEENEEENADIRKALEDKEAELVKSSGFSGDSLEDAMIILVKKGWWARDIAGWGLDRAVFIAKQREITPQAAAESMPSFSDGEQTE